MTEPSPSTDPWGNPLPQGQATPAPPPLPPPPTAPTAGAGFAGDDVKPTDWWGDGTATSTDWGAAPEGPRPSTSPLAVWALVSGIAGFLLCGVVLGPLAIVLGVIARRQIRTGSHSGEGLATAAIVVGVAALLLNVAVIAVLLANPDLMETASP